jgi:pyrroline-5-carboxylate reductase
MMLSSQLRVTVRRGIAARISAPVAQFRFFGDEPVKDSMCTKLAVIGGGQMAEAILSSLQKVQTMSDVHVFDIHKKRIQFLHEKYGITISPTLADCIQDAEIAVLAVKPQNVDEVAAQVVDPPSGMLLSIVAGCTIDNLREKFKTNMICRTMPNTPAMISEGITVVYHTPETPAELRRKGERLLNTIGEAVEVHDEKYLDMATAISGSGPAVRQ